jgi:hypothetical protein
LRLPGSHAGVAAERAAPSVAIELLAQFIPARFEIGCRTEMLDMFVAIRIDDGEGMRLPRNDLAAEKLSIFREKVDHDERLSSKRSAIGGLRRSCH